MYNDMYEYLRYCYEHHDDDNDDNGEDWFTTDDKRALAAKAREEKEDEECYQFQLRNLERKVFHNSPKTGANAHAYNKNINNIRIFDLRSEGYSYREIAKILGISSPSTVRNRYKKLCVGMKNRG